jgi:hypothetical protein
MVATLCSEMGKWSARDRERHQRICESVGVTRQKRITDNNAITRDTLGGYSFPPVMTQRIIDSWQKQKKYKNEI